MSYCGGFLFIYLLFCFSLLHLRAHREYGLNYFECGQICVGSRARVMAEIREKPGMGTEEVKN